MNVLNILENTGIGDVLSTLGIDNALINAGTEASYNLGQKVGRISSASSKDVPTEVNQNIKLFKSSFVKGFINGYFKKDDGTLNWSVLILPIAIVVGLVVLIRKI